MTDEDYPTDDPAVVTCGLPYPTGDLHIGHLRTYVSGDAFSRALRKLGQETVFVSGTDMHGTPIAVQAIEAGVGPLDLGLERHEQYADTFEEFSVAFDTYGHTDEETNVELTREFVGAWEDNDHVYETEIQVAYDPDADQWLPDRYVEGTCPYCGEHARGDECDEGCQRHLEPGEIEAPVSTITGNSAEYHERAHKFLRLSDFQEYLEGFINRMEGTNNAKNQPREWIEGGLEDFCITRDLDWGIDYPGEGGDDLVLYVWVDAPIEYVAATKQYSERVGTEEFDWASVWKDGDGEIIHVIGRDIIQHHTVFWPSMLAGAGYAEPRAVCATGFVNIDGRGLSTSKNRAIWAAEYLDAGFHPDLLRYYLATASGFERDVNFSWEEFAQRVNTELADAVGNFAYRALLFANRNFDGTPQEVSLTDDVETEIAQAMDDYEDALNEYDLRTAGERAVALARFGNEYIQHNEPWNLDSEAAAPVMRDCVQLVKAVAVLLQPFLPEKTETLWAQLGEDGRVSDATIADCLQAPPAEFGEPAELFEKIEDDRVTELDEALAAKIEAASSEDADGEGMADETADDGIELEPLAEDDISFEEFQALDLRVGEVVEAEGIEGADDLARLEVDIGHEVRQIVAGIKQLHDLDALPGTRVVVVANMEPSELFGVESNGMVLAAGEDADLLTTHEDSEPGTKVM
ncbi:MULTISPECIES: methionine--tRNA ligase [Halobacterium]|uniref:methionine--tRNA ligase n=1 Tax=Halobacterium TaxID=2239 RepID=UPI001964B0D9|nr:MULTISPECIES: methionine--tRNA ligase [Halobacterium]MDL0121482.1 methionine--tRNA ligase [Halobacterium salinarum]MDL0133077.1 methionine--tRNA ligase [Halobacterium salinarum]MDL0135595.1 methionine--tRNA ligase [Halobacterium salinarum]QRY25047.1 methionine--tRNA ligase [Halobacterium sp. BOL4-2]